MQDHNLSPAYNLVLLVAMFGSLALLEWLRPLRQRRLSHLLHLGLNVAVSLTVFAAANLAVRPAANWAMGWSEATNLGIISWLGLTGWHELVVGFLLLDLSFYYWHRLNHLVPIFWRFHNVHHLDIDVDVSTGFRFHFVEVFYSALFRIAHVLVIGVSLQTYLIYEAVFQFATFFHHSNIRLPIRLERLLNYVMVTPRMHGIHHSVVKSETNSNYSVVLRWWDDLHRTICLNVPQKDVVIGVAGYSDLKEQSFWRLLVIPFQKQRDYWRFPNGETPTRPPNEQTPRRMME